LSNLKTSINLYYNQYLTTLIKYGIFLASGPNSNYAGVPIIGLAKLHIGDFDTLEDAEEYLKENQITPQHFIMQFWVV
jgi:hypothetical protein